LLGVKENESGKAGTRGIREYYEKYVSLVPGNDVSKALEAQRVQTMQLFAGRSEREGNFRYAAEKWTVKEVLGHLTDSERIFTYRALRIARGDKTPLEGFEQDDYVSSGGFNDRPRIWWRIPHTCEAQAWRCFTLVR
jgi:hypothetical protein